jgi:PD-(D/E)XK nuclease superfamily
LSYWYETGTPTFLLELIRHAQLNPLEFEHTELEDLEIRATNVDNINTLSLMFQTGYLTIYSVERSPMGLIYGLGYPNFEVRQAFSRDLVLEYANQSGRYPESFALKLYRALEKLDWAKFFDVVNSVFASIPYGIFKREEAYPHSLLHLMLLSTGFRVQSQIQTNTGRMDILLETQTSRVVFEIKTDDSAAAALTQIVDKGYAAGLEPPVVLVGVRFDFAKRQILEWQAG